MWDKGIGEKEMKVKVWDQWVEIYRSDEENYNTKGKVPKCKAVKVDKQKEQREWL